MFEDWLLSKLAPRRPFPPCSYSPSRSPFFPVRHSHSLPSPHPDSKDGQALPCPSCRLIETLDKAVQMTNTRARGIFDGSREHEVAIDEALRRLKKLLRVEPAEADAEYRKQHDGPKLHLEGSKGGLEVRGHRFDSSVSCQSSARGSVACGWPRGPSEADEPRGHCRDSRHFEAIVDGFTSRIRL